MLCAADQNGNLLGVYRLDNQTGPWQKISNTPNILPGGQGDYDLCITVDPNNVNIVCLGGDRGNSPPWPANIQYCNVTPTASGYSMTATSIGDNAHSDVHTLVFEPGNSNRIWAGTDGGCFLLVRDSANAGSFEGRNTGLSSLNTNYIGMSETEPAIVYCGLQDNGTAQYFGDEVWRHVTGGDGGYCVVHPTDPYRVLTYANGTVLMTTTGGKDDQWEVSIDPDWSLMVEPLIGSPQSETVAFGAGSTIYISDDFGKTWPSNSRHRITLPIGPAGIYSMVYANNTRLFIGTTNGRVYRADLVGNSWSVARIDNVVGGALGLVGLISDIAIDWSDHSLQSIYVCFGGNGDPRHVWRFDGNSWEARSGSGTTGLLDVEHNALVVDSLNPSNIYVGADIGVWHSANSGHNWNLLQNGLPDAPVFDLQIHHASRLLRASTHGRGLYEYRLDPPSLGGIELYIRHTVLDTSRGENTDGKNDPTQWPPTLLDHRKSPDIKVDVPKTGRLPNAEATRLIFSSFVKG